MDLFGEEFQADPHRVYARLRREDPVASVATDGGLYGKLVTRHDDVRSVLADPRMRKDPAWAPPDWREAGRGKPLEDRSGLGAHLLTTDPPDHTRLRRLVAPRFSARRVDGLSGLIERTADALLDDLGDEFDLVKSYATPLPITVICEILGVPARDRGAFREWSSAIISHDSRSRPAALRAFAEYLPDLVERKRSRPGDVLISDLAAAAITDGELIAMIFLLLIAGFETTINLIGNGVAALLRSPAQLALLREDPGLLEAAVEEVLRYDSPVEIATWRFPSEPVRIGGVDIPVGHPVLVSLASAGRDGTSVAHPDRFDITRSEIPHMSFGLGAHYCLGASLARLEGRIALRTLLRHRPHLALAVPPEDLHWKRTLTVRGLYTLPLTSP